jgi:hypothetical protein
MHEDHVVNTPENSAYPIEIHIAFSAHAELSVTYDYGVLSLPLNQPF